MALPLSCILHCIFSFCSALISRRGLWGEKEGKVWSSNETVIQDTHCSKEKCSKNSNMQLESSNKYSACSLPIALQNEGMFDCRTGPCHIANACQIMCLIRLIHPIQIRAAESIPRFPAKSLLIIYSRQDRYDVSSTASHNSTELPRHLHTKRAEQKENNHPPHP